MNTVVDTLAVHSNTIVIFGLSFLVVFVLWHVQGRSVRAVVEYMDGVCIPAHDVREVFPEDFPKVDHLFYDFITTYLEQRGFAFVGDFENTTLAATPADPRSFMRYMASADKTVVAYFMKPNNTAWEKIKRGLGGGIWLNDTLAFSVESEDGYFFTVMTTSGKGLLEQQPEMIVHSLHPFAGVAKTYKAFRTHLAKFLAKNPGFVPRRFESVDAVLDSSDRSIAQFTAFRESVGYLTRKDFKAMGAVLGQDWWWLRTARKEMVRRGMLEEPLTDN